MKQTRTIWYGAILFAVAVSVAPCAPVGGIFIPRNGGYEGFMGKSHVFIDAVSGGTLEIVNGEWPDHETLARLEMRFAVTETGGSKPVEVRQAFDHTPKIIFIEEGNDRIGVRIKFKLFDKGNLYYGYAMTETWMYPTGEMYLTVAACFEDSLAHAEVTDARLSVRLSGKYDSVTPGTGSAQPASLSTGRILKFDDKTLPGRRMTATGNGQNPLSFYWRTGKMEPFSWPARQKFDSTAIGAPSYYRWPTYLPQAFPGTFSGKYLEALQYQREGIDFLWLDRIPANEVDPTFTALLRIAAPGDAALVTDYVECEKKPVKLSVENGMVFADDQNAFGYVDNEGVYQIRKTGNPMVVTLPADSKRRTVRIKAICLDSCGAVVTKLDGKPVVPHLASEGGIADDPLAPIREASEGPADMALITVHLQDRPQKLTISEEDGVQFVYQTRDDWRNILCFSTKTGKRNSAFRFSLVDGRIRNMRKYGNREWALTENLLTWFKNCGQSPMDMIDRISDFRIVKNGPDEAIFYFRSMNANERAQSEYTVRVPADSPAVQLNVSTTFTVLKFWPYPTNQFFDVFPFRGVDPREWWYDSVLWLTPGGGTKWENTRTWQFEGDTDLTSITGDGFFALCSSDRGNMVMLNKNFKPLLPVHYSICGNYIDYHMDVHFLDGNGKPKPPEKGFTMSMEYDLALWGDRNTTREELIEMGKKSLKAKKLVFP